MEEAEKAKLAQEATLRDESLAMRVATEVARALNLSVRTRPTRSPSSTLFLDY